MLCQLILCLVHERHREMVSFGPQIQFSVIHMHLPTRVLTDRYKIIVFIWDYRNITLFGNTLDQTCPCTICDRVSNIRI